MPANASLSGTSLPTTCLLDNNIVRAAFEARGRVQRGRIPLPHQAQAAIPLSAGISNAATEKGELVSQ